jgi:hypothetical protein
MEVIQLTWMNVLNYSCNFCIDFMFCCDPDVLDDRDDQLYWNNLTGTHNIRERIDDAFIFE